MPYIYFTPDQSAKASAKKCHNGSCSELSPTVTIIQNDSASGNFTFTGTWKPDTIYPLENSNSTKTFHFCQDCYYNTIRPQARIVSTCDMCNSLMLDNGLEIESKSYCRNCIDVPDIKDLVNIFRPTESANIVWEMVTWKSLSDGTASEDLLKFIKSLLFTLKIGLSDKQFEYFCLKEERQAHNGPKRKLYRKRTVRNAKSPPPLRRNVPPQRSYQVEPLEASRANKRPRFFKSNMRT